MNFQSEDISGVLRDRAKIGASLADVDPMNIDKSVRLDKFFQFSIKNISEHIRYSESLPKGGIHRDYNYSSHSALFLV